MLGESSSVMDGKVHLYKCDKNRFWQCATFLRGRSLRISTQEENLPLAQEFARQWYKELSGGNRSKRELKPAAVKCFVNLWPSPITTTREKEMKNREL